MIFSSFQKPDNVSYSEQGKAHSLNNLAARTALRGAPDARESLRDTFQALDRDRGCTAHEKAIARLGAAITADSSIKVTTAVAAGDALLRTISSAVPGSLGATLAATLRSLDYSTSSWNDVKGVSGHLFNAVTKGTTSTDSEKALAAMGLAINEDFTMYGTKAGQIDYYLLELLRTLPPGPLGTALTSTLAKDVPQKLSYDQSAPVGREAFVQMKQSPLYMEKTCARLNEAATSEPYLPDERKGKISSFLIRTLNKNPQVKNGEELLKALTAADYKGLSWGDAGLVLKEAMESALSDQSLSKTGRALVQIGLGVLQDNLYLSGDSKGTILYTTMTMGVKATQGPRSTGLLDALSAGDMRYVSAADAEKILSQGFALIKNDKGATYMEKSLADMACVASELSSVPAKEKAETLSRLLDAYRKVPQGSAYDTLLQIMTTEDFGTASGSLKKALVSTATARMAGAPEASRHCQTVSKIAATLDENICMPDLRKAQMDTLLLRALASTPKDASLTDLLSRVDYSRMTWDEVPGILKEGFSLLEKDRSIPEVERTLARIALVATSLEVNTAKQGVVYYRMLSCMKSHGDGPLWEETVKAVMKSDLSKISWAEYRVIVGEVLKVVIKDQDCPKEMRAVAEKGHKASLSQVLDDEKAGRKAFDSLTQIYSFIKKKHEALQEITEMVQNISDSKEPEKINVVEDDGSQFVEIDGIKLPVQRF